MGLILVNGEELSCRADSPAPTSTGADSCSFTYPIGTTTAPTTAYSVVYANGFVGLLVGSQEIGGNRIITCRYDPEVYRLPTHDCVVKFFGTSHLSISNGSTFGTEFGISKYGDDERIYDYRPKYSISTITERVKVSTSDILNMLNANGVFGYDFCGREYAYILSMDNDSLSSIEDKAKFDLSFNVGTNKRFKI